MLKDKVVLITGGAGLIGREFVETVVSNNGLAVILDVDETMAKSAISAVNSRISTSNSGKVFFKYADISSIEGIGFLVKDLHEEFGRIDALVNNAYPKNKNFGNKLFDINKDDFNAFIDLHLGGYFNVTQQLIKYFLRQGYGNIINISSIQGIGAPAFETYVGTEMHSPIEYTVAKHGLVGMTKYFAKMFKKNNIRVNAISPGGIFAQQPERFLMQYKVRCGNQGMLEADALNGTLLYLLSAMSSYVTGQNIIVDDGFSL